MRTYRLYGYWRSSASWRVRAALAFKGLRFETVPVHLMKDGGEHHLAPYAAKNPLETEPLLEVLEDGVVTLRLAESLAIIEFLEETVPNPPLLPGTPAQRAHTRWLAEIINSGIHPLQNLSTLQELETSYGASAAQKKAWAQRFIRRGLKAVEARLQATAGTYCMGGQLTVADLCLLPQIYNARRYGVALHAYPVTMRVVANLEKHPVLVASDPSRQPDTPAEERRA